MKRLDKKEKDYKEYLKMEKRYNDISIELRNLPLIELEKPYQKGWEVRFDLRDDVKRSPKAAELKTVLDLCFHEFTTQNVELIKTIRKVKSFRDLTKVIEKKTYYLSYRKRHLYKDEYEALPPNIKKYFSRWEEMTWGGMRISYFTHFPSHYIVLKVKPNIITHTREKGGPLEQEYEYLRVKLASYWMKYYNYGKSYPSNKDRTKIRDDINKFMKGEIEEIYNEKIPLEYEY